MITQSVDDLFHGANVTILPNRGVQVSLPDEQHHMVFYLPATPVGDPAGYLADLVVDFIATAGGHSFTLVDRDRLLHHVRNRLVNTL